MRERSPRVAADRPTAGLEISSHGLQDPRDRAEPWRESLLPGFERFRTTIGARQMFSIAVRCGYSSKFWKTMPIRVRRRVELCLSATSSPSTTISPCWNGSSPLTHLISVLLPEPEGPQTTTTSPLETRASRTSAPEVAVPLADVPNLDHRLKVPPHRLTNA